VLVLVNGRANGSPGPRPWLLNILLTNLEATKTHKLSIKWETNRNLHTLEVDVKEGW
jgi:hypothetical protein